MGVVKSKLNEDETIMFNILQFIPVDVEVPCHVTPLSPNEVVYLHGSVTHVDSSAQTINITCYHTKKTKTPTSAIKYRMIRKLQLSNRTKNQNQTKTHLDPGE